MKYRINIVAVLLMGVCLFSCNKDQESFVPASVKGDSSIFFSAVASGPAYSGQIMGNQPSEINLESGVKIMIPAGSIVDGTGVLQTGELTIEVTDHSHISDYVINNLETIIEGDFYNFLNTIKVRMYTADTECFFKEESEVKYYVPMTEEEYEEVNFATKQYNIEDADWNFIPSPNSWYDSWSHNSVNFDGIVIEGALPNDLVLSVAPSGDGSIKLKPCVTLPEMFTVQNTEVFLIVDDSNIVLNLVGNEEGVFCLDNVEVIQGQKIDLMAISSWGESEYYFGIIEDQFASTKTNLVLVPDLKDKFEILDILGMF